MEEVIYIIFHESGEYTSYEKSAIQVLRNKEEALKMLEKYELEILEKYKLELKQNKFAKLDGSYFIEKFIIGIRYNYDYLYPERIE